MALLVMLAFPVNSPGATLSGTVYVDTDGSGHFDEGEWGVRSDRIQLYLQKDDGARILIEEVLTNARGQYHFSDLEAGTYAVVNTIPCNLGNVANVGEILGSNSSILGTPNSALVQISDIDLQDNSQAVNYNFGNDKYPIRLYSKQLLVFDPGSRLQPGVITNAPEPATIFQLLAVVGLAGGWTFFFRKRRRAS